jgi:hypothetical protein
MEDNFQGDTEPHIEYEYTYRASFCHNTLHKSEAESSLHIQARHTYRSSTYTLVSKVQRVINYIMDKSMSRMLGL